MAIDPRQLPLDRDFEQDRANAIALSPEQLTPEAVRQRFRHSGQWTAELASDARITAQDRPALKPAAVLIPLVRHADRLHVLLTHRARHLQAHAGQISFPGGRIESSDDGPVAAALREAREEIGLAAQGIEILGMLPPYLTVTRFDVTPVVGMLAAPIALTLASDEVEDAFEVPLSFLMNPMNHERRVVKVMRESRFVYAMPYHDGGRERYIWGATAAIVRNLYGFLRG